MRRVAFLLAVPLAVSAAATAPAPTAFAQDQFGDPAVEPGLAPDLPLADQPPPQPGTAEVDPFDDVPPGVDTPALDPNAPAGAAPPPADPAMAVEGLERSVEEIAEDVEAEVDAFTGPPRNPLLDEQAEPAPLPLDPADPDVRVITDPAVTIIEPAAPAAPTGPPPGSLQELIRHPYDVFDLREHVAVPPDCLIARQACLPPTRLATTCCGPCGATSHPVPVPGVNPNAAEEIARILLDRTPQDPRLNYLLFVMRYRQGAYEEAYRYLEIAVRQEQANGIPGYGDFMRPIQGRARVYLERVRRLAAETI